MVRNRREKRLWVRARVALAGALCSCLSLPAPAVAQAYQPSFRPEQLKGPPVGKPNEVLVLGTPHLSQLKQRPTPAMLAPLLDRLAGWQPTAIATENLSGLQCDSLRRYLFRYAETVKEYCPDPTVAGRATGLDVPAANAEVERLLAAWPIQPSHDQRRHLALLFLAAGEPGSALVQWLRLPPSERRAADGLTDELVKTLDQAVDRANETNSVAAALAARLGLERLWSVDDHSADTPDAVSPAEREAAGKAISQAWDNPATKARIAESTWLEQNLAAPDGVLQMYRAYNAPGAPAVAYRSDFGAALVEPSAKGYGRQYVGYWETRNLRMVSNIRDVLGRQPGTRLLAIVGASHKGYYEAYLNQMHDVRLVNPLAVLR
ncbi:MAG: hypothetical protein K2X73_07060 [Sphingomonas sp.]|nr:hypothetical protein [Sphingomonas sp.]